jgi:hypothetical protein
MSGEDNATLLALFGAGTFGVLIGWYVYYINRHRSDEIRLSDLVTLVGILGGGSILALFPAGSDLFGAYGIGLFVGFFGYLFILYLQVRRSPNFDNDWFLDGRRKRPTEPWYIPEGNVQRAMGTKDPPINT